MSLEWNSYTIGESCELITGFPFKSKYYLDEGLFKVVRGDNVKEGFIKWDDKKRCWNELNDKLKKVILKEEDIVIGMDGSKLGKNRATISKKDLPALLAQRVACVRAKEGFDQNYIKYVILSNYFKSYVDKVKTGTSIPHISLGQISEFTFEAPDYKKQKTISSILSTIDKKITVNQEINKNLLQIGQLIFNEYVLKKYEPENHNNWKVLPFGEISTVQNGFAFKSDDYCEVGCNMIRTKDITSLGFVSNESLINLPQSFYDSEKYDNYKFERLDTITVMVGANIGKMGLITDINIPSLQNQNMWRFRPKSMNISPAFVYYYVKKINKEIINMATGSARLFYRKNLFLDYDCIIPNNNYLNKINIIFNSLFDKISENVAEIEKLQNLRDTLLPKLMSGEIDVSEVNCDLELKYNYMKYLFNQIHTHLSKSVV